MLEVPIVYFIVERPLLQALGLYRSTSSTEDDRSE
jgi:hypothetical protein